MYGWLTYVETCFRVNMNAFLPTARNSGIIRKYAAGWHSTESCGYFCFNGVSFLRWFEHGTIDLPTIIDYILRKTKHRQVWYSGHSMGTTMFFVMASMRPEYNKKIRHMFALAPVAYMSHLESPIKSLAPQSRLLEVGHTRVHLSPSETVLLAGEGLFQTSLSKKFGFVYIQWKKYVWRKSSFLSEAMSVNQIHKLRGEKCCKLSATLYFSLHLSSHNASPLPHTKVIMSVLRSHA